VSWLEVEEARVAAVGTMEVVAADGTMEVVAVVVGPIKDLTIVKRGVMHVPRGLLDLTILMDWS
jgi:hypothetical protein